MNLELFIAKRIHLGGIKGTKRVSSPAIKIAMAGIAIGLIAMILSVSIVVGFKKEVRNKIVGFGSHLQITNLDNNNSYDAQPICVSDTLIEKLLAIQGIKHIEAYTTKPAIIKTDEVFQGVILKGVNPDFDWTLFNQSMLEGTTINKQDTTLGNQAIVSKNIADKLKLKVGDSFVSYFIQEPIRARKFDVVGVFNTNFEDYDKLFIITELDIIQKLNNWDKDQVSGLELLVDNYDDLDVIRNEVFYEMMTYRDRNENTFFTRSIKEQNPMIFSWLDLLDMNVWVIIILMLVISVFTMTSGLLIIILERTNMIGMLKTFGARTYSIRKIFLYVASFLILRGMLWGNAIALTVIFLQKTFGIVRLNPIAYYVTEVPVDFNIFYILLLNLGTFIVAVLMMIIPSYLIAKITPVKSIRYE